MVVCNSSRAAGSVKLIDVRLTVKAINEELAKRGSGARLEKGDGYFYFSGGEATDWLDRTVNAHSLSSLSLDEWMGEFERLKKLNKDILRGPGRGGSAERRRPAAKRPRAKRDREPNDKDRPCKAALSKSSVGMTQVLVWGYAIPDYLLQLLDLGKPSLLGEGPDRVIADTNLENTSGTGHQRKLADIGRESR